LIVVDTSVILAFMSRRDASHEPVRQWMETLDDELCTTPLVVAEIDYLVLNQGSSAAAQALRKDLARGAYRVEWWASAIHETIAIARKYESMALGMTDASLMALAARHGTTRLATLDERHFRTVRPMTGGEAFTLLPADSP
jgi:predicted nucleic acid-binding protein